MRDFLRGTIGKLLQLLLGLGAFIFLVSSFVSCGTGHTTQGGIYLVLGVLSACATFGIRYWLGHILRHR